MLVIKSIDGPVLWRHPTWKDLVGADLRGVFLHRAALNGRDLSGADLRHVNMTCADFSGADLTEADLTGADLGCANLTRANLTRANLAGAILTGANLSEVDFTHANLADASMQSAILLGAQMGGAYRRGLKLDGAILPLHEVRLPWPSRPVDSEPEERVFYWGWPHLLWHIFRVALWRWRHRARWF